MWRQGTFSTSIDVMACCLMAPDHYLNQCSLIARKGVFFCIHLRVIIHKMFKLFIRHMSLKSTNLRLQSRLPRANELSPIIWIGTWFLYHNIDESLSADHTGHWTLVTKMFLTEEYHRTLMPLILWPLCTHSSGWPTDFRFCSLD